MKAKLIHLLFKCGVIGRFAELERIASELIANGVRLEEKQATSDESKWISVKDRLPEECKEVLSYRFTGCEVDSCVSHKKEYWSYDPVSEYPVTHWMPLPEPPKGE